MATRRIALWLLLSLAAGRCAAAEPATHETGFWRAIIAADYALPEGESPASLLGELSGLLGSRDPEERDEFGYGITVHWIYRQKLLSPTELRDLQAVWTTNLRVGISESGTDSVLRRSFSALNLSILVALDNKSPFLDEAGYRQLLTAALRYLREEQDVRGHEAGIGWLHSPAHTADLLKFLARNRHLQREDQERILEGIADKMNAPGGVVYHHGEDERLARAVLAILKRKDLDPATVKRWLEQLGHMTADLWDGPLDPLRFAAAQNAKNLLKSLYVLVSAEKDPPAPLVALRSLLLETVSGM